MAKFKPTVSAKKSSTPRMVYEWKVGTRIQGHNAVDAQAVGESLGKIEARLGALRPGDVVQEARPAASPLHPLFDWNDETAAEKYRVWQARMVISSVVVTQVDNREVQKPIAAFVNLVGQDEGHHYTSTVSAMSDQEKRGQILRKAHADLMIWRNKYQALEEFGRLFAVIDREVEAILEMA